MSDCDVKIHADNPSLQAAYRRGCRGDACRDANTARVTRWRGAKLPAVAHVVRRTPARPERVRRVRPRRIDRQNIDLAAFDQAQAFSEWARDRGYDPATRTYAEASS
jgi:hypothetical protein